jgi:8-oxo-dGTP diphosphatase
LCYIEKQYYDCYILSIRVDEHNVVGGLSLKREYPTQPIAGVGAVIVQDEKLVLIRRGVEPDKGKWSIPGGGVELGETVRDTAVREAKEECGLDIELVGDTPMDALDKMVPDEKGRLRYHYILLQFLARPKGGTLKPTSDATEARWVPLEEVEKYDLTNSLRLFFKKHRKEMISHK